MDELKLGVELASPCVHAKLAHPACSLKLNTTTDLRFLPDSDSIMVC